MGCDNPFTAFLAAVFKFLLTHPVWDVTFFAVSSFCAVTISTHTSRVGCDSMELQYAIDTPEFLLTHPVWDVTNLWNVGEIHYLNFYSHIPCGMWRFTTYYEVPKDAISTHTSRVGCDWLYSDFSIEYKISTHTSRVGCDTNLLRHVFLASNFYSHIPCGMWHCPWNMVAARRKFLLTHPVWDVTKIISPLIGQRISTHTSRVGCD